jgi:hypothetical protein
MRYLVFIIVVLVSMNVFAQIPSKLKHSEIIVNSKDSTIKANILLNKKKIHLHNNCIYYWYNSDKIESNVGGYYGKLLDGSYVVFDKQRNLVTQGVFDKGLKNRQWKTWYPDGNLKSIEKFKKGKKNGKAKYFSPDGKIIKMVPFKNDLKQGKMYTITPDTVMVVKFKRDQIVHPKIKKTKKVKEVEPEVNKEKKEVNENPDTKEKDKSSLKIKKKKTNQNPVIENNTNNKENPVPKKKKEKKPKTQNTNE